MKQPTDPMKFALRFDTWFESFQEGTGGVLIIVSAVMLFLTGIEPVQHTGASPSLVIIALLILSIPMFATFALCIIMIGCSVWDSLVYKPRLRKWLRQQDNLQF